MTRTVRAGFVPLVDAAVLVAAREAGFARAHGLELELVKQPSWAMLRDHLNVGYIDCAHALAPLPIAATLGIGQVCAKLFAPYVLSRGGNAITLGNALCRELHEIAGGPIRGAEAWGRALAELVSETKRPLTLAMVYPFSGHNYELRYWLAASGLHPDRDLRIVAIPPPLMVESLAAGHVDGFCVGEPWNSLAGERGLGEIVVTKSQIFPRGIEKVLAISEPMIDDAELMYALLPSLSAAAKWCDDPSNHARLAGLMERDEYLGVPAHVTMQALSGTLPLADSSSVGDPDFLFFHKHGASCPRTEDALWLYAQMLRWGQLDAHAGADAVAAGVFRGDIYTEVLGAGDRLPKGVCAFDGVRFDGLSVAAYLQRFSLFTPFGTATPGLQS